MGVEIMGTHEAVGALHCAGKHIGSAYLLPVVVDGLHLRECGVIGESDEVAALVDVDVAMVKFHHCGASLSVGNAPVEGRHGSTVECCARNAEILLLEHFHNLGSRSVHVEQPCHEHRERHCRAPFCLRIGIDGAFAEKTVDYQAFLIHSLGHTTVVAYSIYSAIF